MTITLFGDDVENPANQARLADAARLLGCEYGPIAEGRLIAIENAPGARSVYGRAPLRGPATLAVGNERRGLSQGILARAAETLVIPTHSRTVTTLNVAAAAAVAGWYVLNGSGSQGVTTRPEQRRPAILLIGEDHVEVGSTLRSAAAFGLRDVMLQDEGSGWFTGPGHLRREARAAARAFKNPIRIHRATTAIAEAFERITVVVAAGEGRFLQRHQLSGGARHLIVIGGDVNDIPEPARDRVEIATARLRPIARPPLRLVGSIALAEVARQVGKRRHPATPARPRPRFDMAVQLMPQADVLVVDAGTLTAF